MSQNMKTLHFLILVLVSGTLLWSSCKSTGTKTAAEPALYAELYRPQVHFSPPSGWMNDPNGMVFYEGEYHLFYQYYPDSTVWGPMHWGHAISTDLMHWENLPIALYPDSLGFIFSGSAVVDVNNTSGFGKDGKPAMVAIFTLHDMKGQKAGKQDIESQGIAYSTDKGRTWTKYENNPVLKSPGTPDFRDPKVSWHEGTKRWIMTLAVSDHISFFSSPDLKAWTPESEFGKGIGAHGGVWECPDLFQLPVTGKPDQKKWVLIVNINPGGPNGGSATQYFVGEFDGHKFTNESKEIQWADQGKDNYATVTFSGIPESDGRRISIGWMSNWQYAQVVPTGVWRSAMTLPRELKLINEMNRYVMTSEPVKEIEQLRENKTELKPALIDKQLELDHQLSSPFSSLELDLKFSLPTADASSDFGVELYNSKGENLLIGYDKTKGEFYVNRTNAGISDFSKDFGGIHVAPYAYNNEAVDMHIVVDAASVELFAMKGKVVMTEIFFLNEGLSGMRVYSKAGKVQLDSGSVYKLASIWKK
jgi:fructan beta-fructosidase